MTTPAHDPLPATLAVLLERAQGGDSAALGELLRRYEHRVRLAARSLLRPTLRHALDSLDLVQSVHRALLPGLRSGRYSFASEDQLVALAVTVLRHKVQRSARKARRAEPEAAEEPGAQAPPEAVTVAQDLLTRLQSQLEKQDQQIVEMRLQDYSTVEIAAALKCTPAIVRARLSRLRRRLRDNGYPGEL